MNLLVINFQILKINQLEILGITFNNFGIDNANLINVLEKIILLREWHQSRFITKDSSSENFHP